MRQCRSLAETEIHQGIVQGIDAPCDNHICLTEAQFVDRHRQSAQRTGTCSVDDAIRSTQIKTIRNATRNDISQQTGEGAFLPGNKLCGNLIGDSFDLCVRQTAVAQALFPLRSGHSSRHMGR